MGVLCHVDFRLTVSDTAFDVYPPIIAMFALKLVRGVLRTRNVPIS